MDSVMELAVKILSKCFGGTKVKMIGDIFRNENNILGVFVEVEGVKVFLPHDLADNILSYGSHIADQFIYIALKEEIINIKRDAVIDSILRI